MIKSTNNIFSILIFLISLTSFSNLARGIECQTDGDCPQNYICVETSHGKGVCVVDPNRPCSSNGDCSTGWTCINGTCSHGGAGQSCTYNGHCQTGYVCCNNRCVYSTCRQ
ncbi:MAG: Dickkopf N-terminal cysteine-rich domain-containing protein [Deltaproteobacteria bacterium]